MHCFTSRKLSISAFNFTENGTHTNYTNFDFNWNSLPINNTPICSIFFILIIACTHTPEFRSTTMVYARNSVCSCMLVCFLCGLPLLDNGVEASHHIFSKELQTVYASHVSPEHRTGYHFQPTRNWINGMNNRLTWYYGGSQCTYMLAWGTDILLMILLTLIPFCEYL